MSRARGRTRPANTFHSRLWVVYISEGYIPNMADHSNSCIVSNTKLPVPHLEHPKTGDDYPLRVSFMDQQTVQTGSTVFMTQLSYKFDHWDGTRPINLGVKTFHLCLHSQIVYDFKNCYSAPSWYLSAGWLRPSPKAGVKSASAKIFASSAGITGNG